MSVLHAVSRTFLVINQSFTKYLLHIYYIPLVRDRGKPEPSRNVFVYFVSVNNHFNNPECFVFGKEWRTAFKKGKFF